MKILKFLKGILRKCKVCKDKPAKLRREGMAAIGILNRKRQKTQLYIE